MKKILFLSFFVIFIYSKEEKIKTELRLENYTLHRSTKNNSSFINSRISLSMSKKIDDVLIKGTVFSEIDTDSSRFPENDDGTSFYHQKIRKKEEGLTFSELFINKKLKNSIDLLVGKKAYNSLMLYGYFDGMTFFFPHSKKIGKINFYILSKKAIFDIDDVSDWSNISEKNNSIIGLELKKQFSSFFLELGYHFSSREYINYALKVSTGKLLNPVNTVEIGTSVAIYGKDWASNTGKLNEKLTKVELNFNWYRKHLRGAFGQVKIGDTPHTFLVSPEDILVEEIPNYKNAKINYSKFRFNHWRLMLANVKYDSDERKDEKFSEYSLSHPIYINKNQALIINITSFSGNYDFEDRNIVSLKYYWNF